MLCVYRVCQGLVGKLAHRLQRGAAQRMEQFLRPGAELAGRQAGRQLLQKGAQSGLCGCAEYGAGAVVRRQLPNGRDTGAQIGHGQGLCLIENDHAFGNVVQLPAAGAAVRVQRLKKLHSRGDDDRGVPVLGGQRLAVFLR